MACAKVLCTMMLLEEINIIARKERRTLPQNNCKSKGENEHDKELWYVPPLFPHTTAQ